VKHAADLSRYVLMNTFEELKTQIDRLVVIVRSIGIKCALHEIDQDPNLNFWRLIYGSMLDIAVIEWCKVFGADNQPTHWKKIIANHQQFRSGLLSYLGKTEDVWCEYWESMKDYRNNHAAHHLGVKPGDIYPVLELALKSSFYYYSFLIKEVRGLGYACFPESLESYYNDFYNQTIKVAKAALESTKKFEEHVF